VPHEYNSEEYPDRAAYDLDRVDAYVATWGMNGRQGGETYENHSPTKARAAAAHFLLGDL
jgi:hypothetical protein